MQSKFFGCFTVLIVGLFLFTRPTSARPDASPVAVWPSFDTLAGDIFDVFWTENLERTSRQLGFLNGQDVLKVPIFLMFLQNMSFIPNGFGFQQLFVKLLEWVAGLLGDVVFAA